MTEAIGVAAAVVGGISLVIGLLLGFAGRLFAVQTDPREEQVRAALPGANCGGCGYAGCDNLAAAIARGEAAVTSCPVGGAAMASQLAAIMGVETTAGERQVAFVHCAGTCDKAKRNYNYYGAPDCRQAAVAPGYAGKACAFGCFGLGTCVSVCPANAIHLHDGVAVVSQEACISCGRCVTSCPQHIISMRPETAHVEVDCSSHAPGKTVRAVCAAGCIGCGICEKVCPTDAIHVKGHLSRVEHEKCIACGKCVEKCPTKVIRVLPAGLMPQ